MLIIEFHFRHFRECCDSEVVLELQKRHGLLTSDSWDPPIAKRLGLLGAATADTNFNAAPDWIVSKPADLAP